MKLPIKIFFLMVIISLCCGCGDGETEISDIEKNETVNFPDEIQKDVTKQIKVNAKCIYPENCKTGTGLKANLGEELFWDKQDEIVDLFFENKTIEKEYSNDYGESQEHTYLTDAGETILYISTNNYLNYATAQSSYIQNVISTDTRFDDYNGYKYQEKTDLPFMTQSEAWTNIQEFLKLLGVEISDTYTCYVMDHTVMSQEETEVIKQAELMGEKIPSGKDKWTEEDDCYYFMTRTSWEGYPVLPVIMGEGMDEDNITIIYNKDGIVSLSISGYYPLEVQEEIQIQSPYAVIEKLEKLLENIISDDFYEVQKLTLCQKVTGIDYQKHKGEIEPAWECRILVKSSETDDDGYIQKFYFNAETLEGIQ